MSIDRLIELRAKLTDAATRHDRDASSILVYCGARPGEIGRADLREYEGLGVHSLQVALSSIDELERFAGEVLAGMR